MASRALRPRGWVPPASEAYVQKIAASVSHRPAEVADRIEALATRNREIHERECFNLNPATNVMNPRAEALMASGLGSRPSLGYPGDKYEMGLEAVEQIEVIAAELCAEVFQAGFAEVRVGSGALANLYAFMATSKPGDAIIVPPTTIGGHVTHHEAGVAGLYGLRIFTAKVNDGGYTIDIDGLRALALEVKPKLITVGGSLNLFAHPLAEVRAIADEVGAKVLFDAAHLCGMIAGGAWANPLRQGAHLMTMSTYKSLGGPPGGLLVSGDAEIAERVDAIAYPGLTANFDAGKTAALALCMLDWREQGPAYAAAMVDMARTLAGELAALGVPVFARDRGCTTSHQFAVEAARYGGGQTVSKKLRKAGFLACGIGLPITPVEGDLNGLRIGTPELVRWGVRPGDAAELAALIARALDAQNPEKLAAEVGEMRRRFDRIGFICT